MSAVTAAAEIDAIERRPGAFAGPIDLFLLSLGRKPAAVDVCSKCLSLSWGSALRCHACNARLPACPVAFVFAGPGRTRDTEFSYVEAGIRLRSGWLERPLLPLLGLGLGLAIAMTMACLSGAATQGNWRSDSQARALPVESLAGPDRRRVNAARAEARVGSAMTVCGDRDFLSRAICMNKRCAESDIAPSASCVSALSQRRLDEARRNPLLVG